MNKSIFRLAIPNILSNLSIPLLSSVDTAIIGHLEGTYYLGAIAIGSMIFNFIYWGFGFLRMGTTGLTAQAFGSKNQNEVRYVFYRAIIISVSISLVLLILQSWLADLSFTIVNASDEVEQYARSYFEIRIFAAPATLALYAFHGWFFGIQNARIPLYLTLISNGINVAANLIFVYQFDMKSDGVALGTVCAQYIALLVAIIFYRNHTRKYKVDFLFNKLLHLQQIKRFVSVNFDIFIRTLLLVFTFSFFTAKSAEYGDSSLAANTILLQFWTILAYGIDGFAFAAESLVGRFIGAKDKASLSKAIKLLFIWGITLSIVLSTVFLIFDKHLITIFTNNEKVIQLALSLFAWTIMAPIINCVCYLWDGIYIGATATKAMRNSMIISTLVIFLPVYYFSEPLLGNNSLWLALTIFMFMRGLLLSILSSKHIFRIL